jgi:hypothetical protein
MSTLNISLNKNTKRALLKTIRNRSNNLEKFTGQQVNRTAAKATRMLARDGAARLGLTAKELRPLDLGGSTRAGKKPPLTLVKARSSEGKSDAKILVAKRPLTLSRWSHTPRKPIKEVKTKAQRTRRIRSPKPVVVKTRPGQTETHRKAFVVRLKGRVQIAQRRGKARFPIFVKRGPSLYGELEQYHKRRDFKPATYAKFSKMLNDDMQKVIKRVGGGRG